MVRTSITAKAEYIGPFFEKNVDYAIEDNITQILLGFAEAGEQDVLRKLAETDRGRAALRLPDWPAENRVSDFVVGRVRSMEDHPWHRWVVVSPSRQGLNREQAIGLYAASARVERATHAFRTTATALRRAVKEMKAVDMAKGLE